MHPDNGSWCTIFMICGEALDPADIERRMKFKPSAFVRSGEIDLPTVEAGSMRHFDPRLSLDCWKRSLTERQYRRNLAEQLRYWCNKLVPAEAALRHFQSLGYWTVIDCQGYLVGSGGASTLQFRIPADVRHGLGRLALDLEFAIYGVHREEV